MKLLFSHITNNTNAKSAALEIYKAGLLDEYYTTIAVFPNSYWDYLSKIKGLSEIGRRRFDPVLEPYVKTSPFSEICRQIATKAGISSLINQDSGIFHIDEVSRRLDQKVARNLVKAQKRNVGGVYSFEDFAVQSFRRAKTLGIKNFYDLPIGYWRESHRLLTIEQEKWPEWASTLTGFNDSEKKLKQKDEELQLADAIFVASSFTAKTLKSYPGQLAPIHIIPYGFPTVTKKKKNYTQPSKTRRLKLLFVGGLTQRKGIANLFAAVETLEKHVELTIVGYKASENCKPLNEGLAKHNWIPTLSNDKVLELMRESDVLIFPSLFEGFGLVITEAMSQGTPVITTDRTAGPDIMTHNKDGWLVEAGSTEALKEQIENLLIDSKILSETSKEAIYTAENWTWEDYGQRLTETINKSF
ncbi:glycosyltransferase family 4 protein [Maribacter sp. Hel_I_7]|uniref:glycosyltransferase family 4 protein n=1 Tax=Maribacter sp. Hel_I_7 TaxID=1249997 RepID=UPI00047A3D58|nr:glycosyltransferase family 4 protein [Maribacter sp. Hel_I_7]